MGQIMPRDFVKAVSEYLNQAAPARKKEMIDAHQGPRGGARRRRRGPSSALRDQSPLDRSRARWRHSDQRKSSDGDRSRSAARWLGVSADREIGACQEVWVESAKDESEQDHRGDNAEYRPPLAVGACVVA